MQKKIIKIIKKTLEQYYFRKNRNYFLLPKKNQLIIQKIGMNPLIQ